MPAIILYPESEHAGISEQHDFSSTGLQIFKLHWSEKNLKTSIDPSKAVDILCGKKPISFNHLSLPVLFLRSDTIISEQQISEMFKSGVNRSITDNGQVKALLLTDSSDGLDTSSYLSFTKWLGTKAGSGNSAYDISIVIPLYNGLNYSRALWDSIHRIKNNLNTEWIFVDNNSTDGTKEWLKSLGPEATVILNDQNRNFAGACNQGAKAAKSELIVFLNNDTELTDNCLEELIRPILNDAAVGITGNMQLFPDTHKVHHAGIYFDHTKHPKHYLEGTDSADPRVNFERECLAVTGSCLAIKKQDFLTFNGFSEEFKNGYEDVDLCLKMASSGKKIIYTPKSVIYHHVSKSEGRKDHNHANWQLFAQRWYPHLIPDMERFIAQNREYGC